MVLFPDGELAVYVLDPLLWCVVIIQQSQLESARIAGPVVKIHISSGSSPSGVPKNFQVAVSYHESNSSLCHATRRLSYKEAEISTLNGFVYRKHTRF